MNLFTKQKHTHRLRKQSCGCQRAAVRRAVDQESGIHTHTVCVVSQACLALCDPMDCRPPGPSAHGSSRREYWSGLPFPSAGCLPDPGIRPGSPALQMGCSPSEPPENTTVCRIISNSVCVCVCEWASEQGPVSAGALLLYRVQVGKSPRENRACVCVCTYIYINWIILLYIWNWHIVNQLYSNIK